MNKFHIGDLISVKRVTNWAKEYYDFEDDSIFEILSIDREISVQSFQYSIVSIKTQKQYIIFYGNKLNRFFDNTSDDIDVTYLGHVSSLPNIDSKEKESDTVTTVRNIKYDCSTVKDYKHEVKRMHDYYSTTGNYINCPFYIDGKTVIPYCSPIGNCFNVNRNDTIDRINKLQIWSDEHPEITETTIDLTEKRKNAIYNLALHDAMNVIFNLEVVKLNNKEMDILEKAKLEIYLLNKEEN